MSNPPAIKLRIRAIDQGNTANLTSSFRTRPRTAANAAWNIGSLPAGYFNSPDVKRVVQEVIDRSDWNSGNALAILTETLSSAPAGQWGQLGSKDGNRPAQLVVTYREQVGEDCWHWGCDTRGRCVQVDGSGTDACSNNDDCRHKECQGTSCVVIYTPGTSSCGSDPDCVAHSYLAGFRFTDLSIPPGAEITNAVLRPYGLSKEGVGDIRAQIYAHDTGNSADLSGRFRTWPGTSAEVAWSIGSLSPGYFGSPDIKTVIQEIVDRSDWAVGNALTVLVATEIASTPEGVYARLGSVDGGRRAQLTVDYQIAGEDWRWEYSEGEAEEAAGVVSAYDPEGRSLDNIELGGGQVGSPGRNWEVAGYNHQVSFPESLYDQLKPPGERTPRWSRLEPATEIFYHSEDDLELSGTTNYQVDPDGVALVLVGGDLLIEQDIRAQDAANQDGLIFVVAGQVEIGWKVTQIDALIISDGAIHIYEKTGGNQGKDNDLLINGMLWANGGFYLPRNKVDRPGGNDDPLEVIRYHLLYLVEGVPEELKVIRYGWRELRE